MNAVDTNVLIYTHDPRDAVKQSTAVALVKIDRINKIHTIEGNLSPALACESCQSCPFILSVLGE